MQWNSIKEADGGMLKVPPNWLYPHYYEALSVLFRVENALRVFVYTTLKDQFKDRWQEIALSSEEADGTIGSIAKKRIAQAGSYGYLGYASTCPMLYLNSGELSHLITSDAYWKYFKDSFVAGKNVVKSKLDEINTVRNALAHFRPLKQEDVDLVKQNAKHVLIEVEGQLYEMLSIRNIVPTNTEELWYTTLESLGTAEAQLQFRQSTSERWVQIDIEHDADVLHQEEWVEGYFSYGILNLRASSLLKIHRDLTKHLIYATESLPVQYTASEFDKVTKTVSLVFSRKTLQSHGEEVRAALQTILETITTETELIRQDNLARGTLIENASASGGENEDRLFSVNFSTMSSDPKADDPPEWWGQLRSYTPHLVSGLHKYPWMPSDVSRLTFSWTTDE
jgi:hypothetical protein